MELKQSLIYLSNLKAELDVATEKDQIDSLQHDINLIQEHLKVIQSLPKPPKMTLVDTRKSQELPVNKLDEYDE